MGILAMIVAGACAGYYDALLARADSDFSRSRGAEYLLAYGDHAGRG